MYSRALKTLNKSDGRYLTPEEQQAVLDFGKSLPLRFEASRVVEKIEADVVRLVIEDMRRKYPRFETFHDRAWDKAHRDIELTLRYLVQAMLLDDVEVATDKLLVWMRTILASFNMTPQFVRDTYVSLREAVRRLAPAEAYNLLAPHLENAIEVLSDFPEPATPAV